MWSPSWYPCSVPPVHASSLRIVHKLNQVQVNVIQLSRTSGRWKILNRVTTSKINPFVWGMPLCALTLLRWVDDKNCIIVHTYLCFHAICPTAFLRAKEKILRWTPLCTKFRIKSWDTEILIPPTLHLDMCSATLMYACISVPLVSRFGWKRPLNNCI